MNTVSVCVGSRSGMSKWIGRTGRRSVVVVACSADGRLIVLGCRSIVVVVVRGRGGVAVRICVGVGTVGSSIFEVIGTWDLRRRFGSWFQAIGMTISIGVAALATCRDIRCKQDSISKVKNTTKNDIGLPV